MNTLQKSEFISSPEYTINLSYLLWDTLYYVLLSIVFQSPCCFIFQKHIIDVNRILEFSPNLTFIKSMDSWKLSPFDVKTSLVNKFKKYRWKSINWGSTKIKLIDKSENTPT